MADYGLKKEERASVVDLQDGQTVVPEQFLGNS
jgi:hypothetical protein